MQEAFLGGYSWQSSNNSKTPGVLLEEIYADTIKSDPQYYLIRRFVEHPNCTLDLALRISTMKVSEKEMIYGQRRWEEIKHRALMKVAEITKREGAISR
jgi:hypothetical protein